MKSLKFNHVEAENIKNGIQKATLRMKDDKDLSVDDQIAVIDKVQEDDQTTWTVVGKAVINKMVEQRIGDLRLDGADFESFGSTAELYSQLTTFYGDPIEANTHIKVIYFTFTSYKDSKKYKNVDVKNSTNISEIKLYGDGGSRGNPGPSASGFVLTDMQNNIIETNGEYLSITTNNQAEYHSLKLGLERSRQLGVQIVHVYMDSLLVINQMKGIYKVKDNVLHSAFLRISELVKNFEHVDFTHIPRELNKLADAEVNRILDSEGKMV